MCLFYMSGSRKGERTRVFVRTQDQVAKNVMFTESDRVALHQAVTDEMTELADKASKGCSHACTVATRDSIINYADFLHSGHSRLRRPMP